MEKFKNFFVNLKNKTTKKTFIYSGIFIGLVAIIIGGYFGSKEISKRFAIPEVSGANFSLEYRKIPFDVKNIDISFSHDLDPDSVNSKNFRMDPFVDGKITLKNNNTISYELSSKLVIGTQYSITISKDVKSSYGTSIGKDVILNFEAIAGAKATKIIPEGTLQNLSQNIIVLFNIPIVPLTSLDNKDKLPCPLIITPAVDGKCKWTTSNVLEFIPDKNFAGATEYEIKVVNKEGLLYPLNEELKIKLKTPELEFYIGPSFSPSNGISFRSNFPIDPSELKKNLKLINTSYAVSEDKKIQASLEIDVKQVEGSETEFTILPTKSAFEYSTNYSLSLDKGIKPKYGNIPFSTDKTFYLKSNDFLAGVNIYQNIYSSSGILEDTSDFTNDDKKLIPSKNLFFNLNFGEEITLDKSNFAFIKSSDNSKINFDISYVKEEKNNNSDKKETVENKQNIKFEIKEDLNPNTFYKLVIYKKSNKALKEDIIKELQVTPVLQILDYKYINNTSSCIYFNNSIYNNDDYYVEDEKQMEVLSNIKTNPVSNIRGINKYTYYAGGSVPELCPQKSGQIPYILETRFNPFTEYNITISSKLKDKYGQNLSKDFSKNVKTGDISEQDKYLYTSLNKDRNIIPNNIPIVMNIQSINVTNVNVEVCEMDLNGYLDYTKNFYNQNYNPICINAVKRNLKLKNNFWNLTNNKFDLEKDVFGKSFSSNFIYVRGSTTYFNSQQGYADWQKEFKNLFIRSNLSLTYESATNKDIIFASSFDGKDIPGDLKFETYNDVGTKGNITANFDNQTLTYQIKKSDTIIIAKNNKYFGIIDTRNDATSNYDFSYISGQDSATKDFLYIYTDRPIYRPGDTAFFKGLLRTFDFTGYKKSEVKKGKLKILDNDSNFFKEIDISIDKNSNFNGSFTLPNDMKLGRFIFEFYPDTKEQNSIYNDGQFFVEEYKKPTFKVNLENVGPLDVILGDKANIKLSSEYYFGGKLINAKYSKSILTQDYFFDAKDYSDYQFGEGYKYFDCLYWGFCDYNDYMQESSEGVISSSGEENISYNFPSEQFDGNKNSVGEKIYNFNFTVEDPTTKNKVSKTISYVLHNTDGYVGIKSSYWNTKTDGIKFSGIVLDQNIKPISGKEILIGLYKNEWKNVKKQGVDGVFYNDYTTEKTLEKEIKIVSDSNGEFSDNILTKSDGQYEIKATYIGKNGKSFDSYSMTYVSGDTIMEWNNGNNTTTDLVAEKSILKVGDTANFTLKSPVKSGKMFVTIEKDSGILDYFTDDITSSAPKISITVKDNYYPNFYVKVFLIGKNDSKDLLPIFKRALGVIKVVTDYKKLKVVITPEKNNYLPGEKIKLNVKVTDNIGNPVQNANGNISIVDESLLALKGNPKKNPFAFFYDMKRFLGTSTYLSLMNLIEKLEIKDISDGAKGGAGDGQKGGDAKKKRGIFKDTAFWQADFLTDKNGETNIVTSILPDNLTTWNIESVVNTPENKFGVGETTIMTTKQVVINENIPRFFGSKDNIVLAPIVFNKTGKDSSFTVSISATNLTLKDKQKEVFIKNGEQVKVEFSGDVVDIGVNGAKGELTTKLNFKAVSKATGDTDEIEKIIPIKESSTPEFVSTVGKTDSASFEEKINLKNVILSSAKLVVNYSATLLSNITSGIDYLKNYPYGCIEQKTSVIMPNIFIKKLYDSLDLPFDLKTKMIKKWVDNDIGYKDISVDETIKNYLAEIKSFQLLNGGFNYWAESQGSFADFNLTSYLVESISNIKDLGYKVDENILAKAISYLKNRFYENKIEGCYNPNKWNNFCKYSETERLNAIISILTYNKSDYEGYKMWKLLSLPDQNEISTKIKEVKVLALLKKQVALNQNEKKILIDRGIKIVNYVLKENVVYNPKGAFLGKDIAYSRLLNTANFIEAISEFGLDQFKDISQIIDGMNRWVISQKKEGNFGSTQDNISVIRGAISYIKNSGELKNTNMNVKAVLNSTTIDEKTIDSKNKLDVFSKTISGEKLSIDNIFSINKSGVGNIYYDLNLSYYLPTKNIQSRDEGFYIDQIYFDYNQYKKIESLKKEEWEKYLTGEINYEDLKYPKSVIEYIIPVSVGKIGQLIIAYNKVITSEPRDKVAFEGFIPAGSELVNTNLSTEDQNIKFNTLFEQEEFRDDRYFGYKTNLDAGVYEFNYILRLTHDGVFSIKPAKIFEFYNLEVFGRTKGREFKIEN